MEIGAKNQLAGQLCVARTFTSIVRINCTIECDTKNIWALQK